MKGLKALDRCTAKRSLNFKQVKFGAYKNDGEGVQYGFHDLADAPKTVK